MYTAETYLLAQTPAQAAELLRADGKNAILAGSMWMRTLKGKFHTLIDISALGLNEIREREGFAELGAMVTLRQVETSDLLGSRFGDALRDALRPIIGVQFRNMATVGGSVFGKYAFSDLLTVLLALDTQVVFQNLGTMPLETYLATTVERDLLVAVRIPTDGRKAAYQTHRLSGTDFGVLDVCAARLPAGAWRVSVGSRPGRPIRCPEAESLLAQGDIDGAKAAVRTLPYADCIRASADYRRALSAVLLERAWSALQEVVR